MNANSGQFPTYKGPSPVLKNQTTSLHVYDNHLFIVLIVHDNPLFI